MEEHGESRLRISSGNTKLDITCGGGFYRDSLVLTCGPTGTGKTLMAATLLDEGCRRGEKTLFVAFDQSRRQLLQCGVGWRMNLRKWEEAGLLTIDCRPPETADLVDHLARIEETIDAFGPTRIAVDGLWAAKRVASVNSFRRFVVGLSSHVKQKEIASLFTTTTPLLIGRAPIADAYLATISDVIILLCYVELRGEIGRGLTVLKMRRSWHDKLIRQYKIDDDGLHLGAPFNDVSGIFTPAPLRQTAIEDDSACAYR